MDHKKHSVQVESDGSRSVPVPLWQELPQITVRLKEGNTTYRFTASFDGKHTLPEKAVRLIDSEKGVRCNDRQQPCLGRLSSDDGGICYETV